MHECNNKIYPSCHVVNLFLFCVYVHFEKKSCFYMGSGSLEVRCMCFFKRYVICVPFFFGRGWNKGVGWG